MLSARLKHQYLFLAVLLLCVGCASVPEPQVAKGTVVTRTYEFKEANKPMEYALFVPTGYDRKRATPLVVLLHGLGSNPTQVINYEGVTTEAEKRGWIVVAPFGYNTGGWYGSQGAGKTFGRGRAPADSPDNLGELSEKDVLNVLELIRKEFRIDGKRTYLMGHSMGGGGSFYLGMKYRDNWAALAPMSPAIYSSPDELKKIRDIPVIVVQGDKDNLVPVAGTRLWVEKMKQLNMTHKYIEIAGGNHFNSITRNPQMIHEVFDFLAQHPKQ